LLEKDYTFYSEFKPQEITQFAENELVYFEKGVDQKIAQIFNNITLIVSAFA